MNTVAKTLKLPLICCLIPHVVVQGVVEQIENKWQFGHVSVETLIARRLIPGLHTMMK
jgi:hypothetical protein